jgi:hypothetical protein
MMLAVLVLNLSLSTSSLSVARPLGSPTLPVAPPTTAMGCKPLCLQWRRADIVRRWPTCREAAVGSNPQYTAQPRGGGEAETLSMERGCLGYRSHVVPHRVACWSSCRSVSLPNAASAVL